MKNGTIWVVELWFGVGDWRPFKMYDEREKAEQKLRRLVQYESESKWRVSAYYRGPSDSR